jgi:hypothetical protein
MSIFSNTPFDPSTWDPSTWRAPAETPSTFGDPDPTFTENRYQIAFHNETQHIIAVYCLAYNSRTGAWSGDPNHYWPINPGQTMPLEFPGIGPFVGNYFHLFAVSTDKTLSWGSPQAPLSVSVGPPYNTTGGFQVHVVNLFQSA